MKHSAKEYPQSFWDSFSKKPQQTFHPNKQEHNLLESYGNFSLREFLARYLCGGEALTNLRNVSRMRLALARIGIDNGDTQAKLLQQSIDNYEAARDDFLKADEINLDILLTANNRFSTSSCNKGKFRTTQTWVGESRNKATYLPPNAELVLPSLNDLHKFINQNRLSEHMHVSACVWLMAIHPFYDANGRTARALFDAFTSSIQQDHVHLSLYRFGKPHLYRQALWAFGVESEHGIHHPYWQAAIDWRKGYQIQAFEILKNTKQALFKKIGLHHISGEEKSLMDRLWRDPVLSLDAIYTFFNWPPAATRTILEKLIALNILRAYPLKRRGHPPVFVCEDIISAWQQLDDAIFANKKSAVNF